MLFKGIILDFIGTTAMEKDASVINRSLTAAFHDHGITIAIQLIKANRGKDKREMIKGVLHQMNRPYDLITPVLDSFKIQLENNLDNFYENEGTRDLIAYCKSNNIIVGLATGLPRDVFEKIIAHLDWKMSWFDYIGIAEETGRGRPYPDMILDMLRKCNLRNNELLKVGDTIADILEGKSAGVKTAAILSGTQAENEIISHQPDYIIRSLSQLQFIMTGEHPVP